MDNPKNYIDDVIADKKSNGEDSMDLWSGNKSSPVRRVKLSEVKCFLAPSEANDKHNMPLPLDASAANNQSLVAAEKPRRYPKRTRKEVQCTTKQVFGALAVAAVVVSFNIVLSFSFNISFV